jgi:hypothetical protein
MSGIIAIDPGASGGIAVDQGGRVTLRAMPDTRGDCITHLRSELSTATGPVVAYIEKINGYIPMAGASMMFEFGKQVERIGCILEVLGCRIIEVPPQTWQKALGLGNVGRVKADRDAGEEDKKNVRNLNAKIKRDWKNKLKAEAQRRFPGVSVTLETADALLILEYARIQERKDWL